MHQIRNGLPAKHLNLNSHHVILTQGFKWVYPLVLQRWDKTLCEWGVMPHWSIVTLRGVRAIRDCDHNYRISLLCLSGLFFLQVIKLSRFPKCTTVWLHIDFSPKHAVAKIFSLCTNTQRTWWKTPIIPRFMLYPRQWLCIPPLLGLSKSFKWHNPSTH